MQKFPGIVVIGGGHAGGRMVGCLRDMRYEGELVLIGDEIEVPYERPPLSKEFLAGPAANDAVGRLHEKSYYTEHNIGLRLSCRVTSIDTSRKCVELEGSETLDYSQLIIATGSRPRRLNVSGADLPGVYYLRSTTDAIALRRALTKGSKCCVIGAGLIGLEVAASAISRGCRVTVVESAERIMTRIVPAEVSELMQALHEQNGVAFRLGQHVQDVVGESHVEAIRTGDGEVISADVVVVGIGAEPNVELAALAKIECDDGILVDEFGRTRTRDVFAIGDVSKFWNPRFNCYQRLESWDHAQRHPENVAKFIVGQETAYFPLPWAWTDQYDVNLQVLGGGLPVKQIVVRGSLVDKRLIYFGLNDDRVVAAWLVNSGRERRPISTLISSATIVNPGDLTDIDIPLRGLANRVGANQASSRETQPLTKSFSVK